MTDFDVKVRNLETGETLIASMADCEMCIRWLSQRPRNVEILSVLGSTTETERERLHAAMRPYDAAELALKRKYDEARMVAAQEAYAAELARMQQEASAAAEDPNADPHRPMSIHYDVDEGLTAGHDRREITEVVKAAVAEWLTERNGWIHNRGQFVGEADVEVWPGAVPEGETRVREGGRFYPRLIDG